MAEDLFAPVLRMVGRTPEDRAAFLTWKTDHDRQVAERIAQAIEARVAHIGPGSDLRFIHDECAAIARADSHRPEGGMTDG